MFEFDSKKSNSNKKKHGIDFVEAQLLFEDPDLLVIPSKDIVDSEFRELSIGLIYGTHWSAITTQRGEAIRIISIRKSTQREIKAYES